MILQGRGISRGEVEGNVVKVKERVSFLGDVDPKSGQVFEEKNLSDAIFVFPGGKGSTVGSYVLYQLKKNGKAPLGMVNRNSETIVASGAIISDIPLVDKIDLDLLEEGDEVRLDGKKGEVELHDVDIQPVVTAFLKKNDSVLLLKRSEEVGTYRGRWAGVSGYLENRDPLKQAKIEIKEETKLDAVLISKGETVKVREEGEKRIWEINPFLFEVKGEPELNWENKEYIWVDPKNIQNMNTVPRLWDAYVSLRDKDENQNG